MAINSGIPHLKDYPYHPPKKILPLTNYSAKKNANSSEPSIGSAIGTAISTSKGKHNRFRSASDLSESPSNSSMESTGSSNTSNGCQTHACQPQHAYHSGPDHTNGLVQHNSGNGCHNHMVPSTTSTPATTPAATPMGTPSGTPSALYIPSFSTSCSGSPSRSASGSPVASARSSRDLSNKELCSKDMGFKDWFSTISYFNQPQNDFLAYLEPNPVSPPEYGSLPPGGCPKFPIMDCLDNVCNEPLPQYTPAIYKVITVSRKLEWLNPYEPSTSRSWKHVIMELNSTQLNFYAIPNNVELHLLNFQSSNNIEDNDDSDFPILDSSFQSLKSSKTSKFDYEFFKCCQRLSLTNDLLLQQHDSSSSTTIDNSNSQPEIRRNHSNFSLRSMSRSRSLSVNSSYSNVHDSYNEDTLKPSAPVFKKLIRSYSLQHCRIGLATDYKKRSNCLRLRIENEQMLINFDSIKDLINWNLYLSVGKDLALDLTSRDIPRYRTVPRRRRRREIYANYFNDSFNDDNDSNFNGGNDNSGGSPDKLNRSAKSRRSSWSNQRLRSNSDPMGLINQFKSKFKLRSNSQVIEKRTPMQRRPTCESINESSVDVSGSFSSSVDNSCNTSISDINMNDDLNSGNRNGSSAIDDDETINDGVTEVNDANDTNDTEQRSNIPTPIPTPRTRSRTKSSGPLSNNNNSQSLSMIHNQNLVEDEDEGDPDLSDINSSDDDEDDVEQECDTGTEFTQNESDPEIIRLTHATDPNRKTHQSILTDEDEKWHPTSKPQTQRKYYKNCLRCIKPLTMDDSWVSKVLVKPTNLNPNYTLSNSRESLNKLPNHYVKEFVVGSHGLIPRHG